MKFLGMLLNPTIGNPSSFESAVQRLLSSLKEIYRIILSKKKLENFSVDHDDILTETFITFNNSIRTYMYIYTYIFVVQSVSMCVCN